MTEAVTSLDDIDFKNLPPLVPKGADRQKILDEVVERWASPTEGCLGEDGRLYGFKGSNDPATLKNIDFRDDNQGGDPIDFGDLLRSLQTRILSNNDHSSDSPTVPKAIVSVYGCRIQKCQCKDLNLPSHILAALCHFDDAVNFRDATVCGNLQIINCEFVDTVDFSRAVMRGLTLIGLSIFHRRASFHATTFRLINSDFSNNPEVSTCTITGSVFHAAADFGSAVFANIAAIFGGTTFAGSVIFSDADFFSAAGFHKTNFTGTVKFNATRFSYNPIFADADLRQAQIAKSFDTPLQQDHYWRRWRRWRLWATDWLNWAWARKTGELTVLTRVSYLALVLVPIMAGIWGPVRGWIVSQNDALSHAGNELNQLLAQAPATGENIQEWQSIVTDLTNATLSDVMPTSWLLAFLAAFAIVLAQLVYQTNCPELIRRNTVGKLIDEASETNRRDAGITQERLRQAIDFLHGANEAMPHRYSAWFVTRGRRTVWIPNNLTQFKNATIDGLKPKDASSVRTFGKTIRASDQEDSDQEIDAEDRKRIALEEGQKARYAIEAFRNRSAAWVSGGLYILGGWFLLIIVMRQLGNIAAASAAPWLGYLVGWSRWGWFIVGVAVLVMLATALGAILVNTTVCEKLDQWSRERVERKEASFPGPAN